MRDEYLCPLMRRAGPRPSPAEVEAWWARHPEALAPMRPEPSVLWGWVDPLILKRNERNYRSVLKPYFQRYGKRLSPPDYRD